MSDNLWAINDGVYFGRKLAPVDVDASRQMCVLDLPWKPTNEELNYRADRHLITIGPNGSGKTRRLLIPNLLRLLGWSCVVVDPKGKLAMQTASFRRQHGNEILTLDPFGALEAQYPGITERQPYLRSVGINPVAMLDPASDDFPDDAKKIAEALIKVEGNEPYFCKSAQALVTGLIMAVRLVYGEKGNLSHVRKLLGLDAETLGLVLRRRTPDKAPGLLDEWGERFPELAAKLNRFANVSTENREIMSVLSTAVTQTDWLDSRPVQRDLKGGAYDFGQLKHKPVTVYLILPPRYLETHATWLRIVLTAILLPLIRTLDPKVPTLFMLDEFAQLGRLEIIEQNMALCREYGIKLWPMLQDLSQLKDHYKDRWESFIGNAGIRHLFGPQDVTTQEYFSKLSGQRLYWLRSESFTTGETTGASHSVNSNVQAGWQNIQGPAYWPQSLAAMQDARAVLFGKNGPVRAWLPDPSQIEGVASIIQKAEHQALHLS